MTADFDWTTDTATTVVNSSTKFKDVVADVKRLLSLFIVGQNLEMAENTATLIVAIMAHTHRLSPNSNWTDWTCTISSDVVIPTRAFSGLVADVKSLIYQHFPVQNGSYDILASLIVNQTVQKHLLSPPVMLNIPKC
ncbi:hypothetical protein KBC70_02485 [Candidatus Woesebacteria bacterium]|nr:hypothetical protein [Candidatus Woesebacteria bacterium]